jgi:hypothetical protein
MLSCLSISVAPNIVGTIASTPASSTCCRPISPCLTRRGQLSRSTSPGNGCSRERLYRRKLRRRPQLSPVCDAAGTQPDAQHVAQGIRHILDGTIHAFSYEYDASSSDHSGDGFASSSPRCEGRPPTRCRPAHRRLGPQASRSRHDQGSEARLAGDWSTRRWMASSSSTNWEPSNRSIPAVSSHVRIHGEPAAGSET